MDWLLTNWFWILIFVLFIAMHFVGHGGHGGHSDHGGDDPQGDKAEREKDEAPGRAVNTSSAGHQH